LWARMVLGRASSAMLVVGSASVLPGVMLRACERLGSGSALIASVLHAASLEEINCAESLV